MRLKLHGATGTYIDLASMGIQKPVGAQCRSPLRCWATLVSWNARVDGDGFRPERMRSPGVPLEPAACASSRRASHFQPLRHHAQARPAAVLSPGVAAGRDRGRTPQVRRRRQLAALRSRFPAASTPGRRYEGPDPQDFHTVVLLSPVWIYRLAGPMPALLQGTARHCATLPSFGERRRRRGPGPVPFHQRHHRTAEGRHARARGRGGPHGHRHALFGQDRLFLSRRPGNHDLDLEPILQHVVVGQVFGSRPRLGVLLALLFRHFRRWRFTGRSPC